MYIHAGWHDDEDNKVGKLTTVLSSDVAELKMLTGNLTSTFI